MSRITCVLAILLAAAPVARVDAYANGDCKLIKFTNAEAAFCTKEHNVVSTKDNYDAKADLVAAAATSFWETDTTNTDKTTKAAAVAANINEVDVVFSFGAADFPESAEGADDGDKARNGFARIQKLCTKFMAAHPTSKIFGTGKSTDSSTAEGSADEDKLLGARYYLDANALAKLPGAFWKFTGEGGKTDANPGPFALNLYWMDYYQKAMNKAKVMVFLLTKGWFASKWCGEELTWASGTTAAKRTDESHKNIVILLDSGSEALMKQTSAVTGSLSTAEKWKKVMHVASGELIKCPESGPATACHYHDMSEGKATATEGSSDARVNKIYEKITSLLGPTARFQVSHSGLRANH